MGRKRHHFKDNSPNSKTTLTAHHIKLLQLADKLILLSTALAPTSITKNIEQQIEINEIIDQVQMLEKDMEWPCLSENRSDNLLCKFTTWLSDNGANYKDVQIAEFSGYDLGLKAEVDIDETNLIMTIPRNLMITVESAKDSPLQSLIETDPLLNNMPNVTLAIFLLLEKFKGNSFWKPYIDILPNAYSTVLYFSIDELKELQSSPTLEIALKQIRNIVRQYAYFYKLIWSLENPVCKLLRKHFTFNQYRWAVSTIMTRQNTIPSEDGLEIINALIPLWDFSNHTNGEITTSYNPKLECCECFALKHFKAGEQVFIFYGIRSNPELFIHNGFIVEDNEHDGYWIRLGISKSDALKKERLKVLNRLSLPEHGEFCLKTSSHPVEGQLLSFLRIFNMDEEQLCEWEHKEDPESLQDIKLVFDKEFENKYWTFTITRLKLILSTYKTSLQQDLELIKENSLSPNGILVCKMRASEKRLLENAIKYIQLLIGT